MASPLLRQALDALPTAALLVDEARCVLFANQAAERLYGSTREALVAQPVTRILREESGTLNTVWLSRHLSETERALLPQPIAVRLLRSHAAELDASLTVTALTADSGETQFLLTLQESRVAPALLRQVTLSTCLRAAIDPAVRANTSAAGSDTPVDLLRVPTAEFGAALVRLWLIEAEESIWRLHLSVGCGEDPWERNSRPFVEAELPPEVREAANQGRPYLGSRLQSNPLFNPEWLVEQGVDSVAAFPLYQGGTLRGVLAVFGQQPFREETVTGLAAFSAITALLLGARTSADCPWSSQECQTQHLQGVGALAGGVAHEFNNMLAVILGQSELLLERLEAGDPMRQAVESIQRAGERTAEMTRQLLAFGRRQFLDPRLTDLSAFINRLKPEITGLAGPSIRVIVVPDANPETVCIDPQLLREAILTLVQRACTAMPKGGTLTLTVRGLGPREAPQGVATAVPHVSLTIADTGPAMSTEERARLFEPFYGAGPSRGPAGLDLAAVYGFFAQSGGYVRVDSEPGRGTAIRIYLPRAALSDTPPERTQQSLISPNGH